MIQKADISFSYKMSRKNKTKCDNRSESKNISSNFFQNSIIFFEYSKIDSHIINYERQTKIQKQN